MQTERVTFLADRELKASLEAFATAERQSLGHVLREASHHWISQPAARNETSEDEEALAQLGPLIEELLPQWSARIASMERSIDEARHAINEALAGDPA